jgi:Fic family protein
LLHVQFETLHPYSDGNGRLGRLLITLLLHWGLLSRPLLYGSLFVMRHRQGYYRRLNAVREMGDWGGLARVLSRRRRARRRRGRRRHVIVGEHRDRLRARDNATFLSIRLCELLPDHPILTVNRAIELLHCSRPAAGKALGVLEAVGIVQPLDERRKKIARSRSRLIRRSCARGWS